MYNFRLAENHTVTVKTIPLNDKNFCETFSQNFLVISEEDYLAALNWTSADSLVKLHLLIRRNCLILQPNAISNLSVSK